MVLWALKNGLRNYEDPSYGGWGGRYYKVDRSSQQGFSDRSVKSGETVSLNANGTIDPDGHNMSFRWWQ